VDAKPTHLELKKSARGIALSFRASVGGCTSRNKRRTLGRFRNVPSTDMTGGTGLTFRVTVKVSKCCCLAGPWRSGWMKCRARVSRVRIEVSQWWPESTGLGSLRTLGCFWRSDGVVTHSGPTCWWVLTRAPSRLARAACQILKTRVLLHCCPVSSWIVAGSTVRRGLHPMDDGPEGEFSPSRVVGPVAGGTNGDGRHRVPIQV
jgi:hypothetical protein